MSSNRAVLFRGSIGLVVIFGALLNVGAALAAPTKYDDLAKRFEGADVVKVDKQKGWYSGRCYGKDAQDYAVGAALVLASRIVNPNEGPLFAKPVTKMIMIGRGDDGLQAPATTYDVLKKDVLTEINESVEAMFKSEFHLPVVVASSVYSDVHSEVRYEIKSDKKFVYGRIVDLVAGTPIAQCYFFKRLK